MASRGNTKVKGGIHIHNHQELHNEGREPDFVMRVVGFDQSALNRQMAEAVRIQMGGGAAAVLNSKSEYNRSYIPHLVEEAIREE